VREAVARLDHVLSRYGYCSRREAKQWIGAGRVTVGALPANSASQKAVVGTVRIDGEAIECPSGILAIMNKPAGVVCSHDPREGPTIYDSVPARWLCRKPRVTSVGRLDKDATGAILITDIPGLVQRWTSPRRKVLKVYEVTVDRPLDPALVELFGSGRLQLNDESKPCRPARLVLAGPSTGRLEVIEGIYHQVRRMFASQGYEVIRLHRSHFGDFSLGDLQPGEWRFVPIPVAPPT
jgi:16S rRNA pseudouridine516 synthase